MITFKEFLAESKDLAEAKSPTNPKVGHGVFSKNDTEIYGTVTKVSGTKVTVNFRSRDGDWSRTVPARDFRAWNEDDQMWDFPNWYFL